MGHYLSQTGLSANHDPDLIHKGKNMKQSLLVAALVAVALTACGKKEEAKPAAPAPAVEAPKPAEAAAPAAAPGAAPAAAPGAAAPAAAAPAAPAAAPAAEQKK